MTMQPSFAMFSAKRKTLLKNFCSPKMKAHNHSPFSCILTRSTTEHKGISQDVAHEFPKGLPSVYQQRAGLAILLSESGMYMPITQDETISLFADSTK